MYAFASRGSFRVFPVGCKMFLLNLLCGMGSLGTFVIGIVIHPKLIQVFVALQRNAIEGKFSNNSRKLSFSIRVMTGVNSSRQR